VAGRQSVVSEPHAAGSRRWLGQWEATLARAAVLVAGLALAAAGLVVVAGMLQGGYTN
jgi:hypothetical protein